ncbi:Micrococcal nuclease (thermonuclease) homologs [uncultured Candidatus Thioglobus sp.]|nr:Micrococcal nuclease (thermonuclease) homologs [uncultured Candidatus Thioglobus sp.]
MHKTFLITLYCSLIGITNAAPKTYGDFTVFRVISVYDGDTIRVDIKDCNQPLLCKNIGIRVHGIDTPEIRGKCIKEKRLAKQARKRMREILAGAKTITLKNTGRGKYFRIVAQVFADGREAGKILIGENLAYRYFGGKKTPWCKTKTAK